MRSKAVTQFFGPIAAAALLAGCQTAHVSEPLTAKLGGADDDAQMEFWHTLAAQPVTCNDDAFHGLLIYLDGQDTAKDYGERLAALRQKHLLPSGFNEPATQAVRRGTLAVAIVKSLNIRGGWAMHVFGPTERYATRELQYLDLYPPSAENQTFSGAEFVGVMGKFEDAQREAKPAAESAPGRTLEAAPDVQRPADRQPTEAK